MEDLTDDLSGTGVNQDRWNIFGDPNNLVAGTAAPIPCFGIAPGPNNLSGSNFAKPGTGCTVVPAGSGVLGSQSLVANLPAECLIAAGVSDTNPSVPAANNGYGELVTLGCYLQNGTAIAPTAQGTYGNMGRNVLRGQPFKETDLSITKTWKFGERL